ncbi:MAG: tetratricopeptide repeat protein [Gammaproteobacteria bacterium]|nr:tetratricopeptide repeat protein [Gammaproteobacteria bacterium]MDP2141147.1 tetratricopeptide repeat protein [Gammaproteobacteria bacterium]MDP2349179.1 tetratricopeptide repeat protein [Gammaproteobacteria bacterium]
MLKLFKRKSLTRDVVSALAMAGVIASASMYSLAARAAEEPSGPRAPPPTRTSDVLTERVFRQVSDIQALMSPEDATVEPNYARAKVLLDELYERYDRLNDFEKSTVLNFYTNYYLNTDNIPEALRIFEQILTIENLRIESRQRALMALGQLYMGEERFQEAIDAFNRWRDISDVENENVYLGLANSHYNLAQYNEAIPYLINHMDLLLANGRTIAKNIYGLLNLMYIELEDYVNAERITKQMVTLFDEPSDWRNLSAIYGYLDNDKKRIETLSVTFAKGYMENESEYLNLAQSLAGIDAAYKGARVLARGFELGIVEENESNLQKLVQMYLLANEYEMALAPAIKAAELGETGASYDQLGYIYYMMHDYQNAADSIRKALERGGLSNAGDAQLFLARALVELDQFDEAAAAARRAQDLGETSARTFLTFIENSRARFENLKMRKEDAIEFYRS